MESKYFSYFKWIAKKFDHSTHFEELQNLNIPSKASENLSKMSQNAHGSKCQGKMFLYGFQYFLISFKPEVPKKILVVFL